MVWRAKRDQMLLINVIKEYNTWSNGPAHSLVGQLKVHKFTKITKCFIKCFTKKLKSCVFPFFHSGMEISTAYIVCRW